MTSIPSAQTRPFSKFKPPVALLSDAEREHENVTTLEEAIIQSPNEELEHPAKRRKTETFSSTSDTLPFFAGEARRIGENETKDLSRGPWHFSESFLASFTPTSPAPIGPPPPLPSRPWQHQLAAKLTECPKVSGRIRKDVPIPNTPDKLDLPAAAPKLGKSALAGFLPWTGKHAEDVLSEPNVRHGYFDRPQNPPEKEVGSARNALFSAFKNRSGLDTLSVLFGLAIERKCKNSALSSTSNFRPPPRVTLTEAKRKAWLADLANPQVPLRRLSRTIPQGIRGQSLLEQCLSNAVPISRAVWFIKCVGANEIRTLKRKGPGGAVTGGSESKWLKEWTSLTAEFIVSVSQQLSHSERGKDMKYSLRLIWQLYSENLLDRDLFLDWILTYFAAAEQIVLPFPLLLIRIYLSDLIRFRRRSRKLVIALLEQFDVARRADGDMPESLASKLKELVKAIAISRPVCFIIPDKWSQCKDALQACLDPENEEMFKLSQYIKLQNQNTAASFFEESMDTSTPQQAIIRFLDQSKAPFYAKAILKRCLCLCPDIEILMRTILKWATSRYRSSAHSLYLAIRLLRMLDNEGYDVECAVFELVSALSRRAINLSSLHHLIAELSRSQTISISKYLQTMIVRGNAHADSFEVSKIKLKQTSAFGSSEIQLQTCIDISQILTEISLKQLPSHVRSLRKRVLSRAGFSAEIEDAVIHHCEWYLSKKFSLANEEPGHIVEEFEYSVPPWNALSWTVKCEISAWLRQFVQAQCEVDGDPVPPFKTTSKLGNDDFCFIRDVLESMEDLATLADVVNLVSTIPQESLLASAIDTMDRHASTFSALGAFHDLHEKVCTRYIALRPSKLPMTALTVSLMDLNGQHQSKIVSMKLLRSDLIQGDRGSAAAACSPFSDGVAESLQQAGSHFFDDFEAILQTETNMNEQTMTKLFAVLTERIEKHNVEGEHLGQFRALCQLLTRLRSSRPIQANTLIKDWISRALSLGEWVTTTALLVDLVGSSSLQLESVMNCIRDVTTRSNDYPRTLGALIGSLFTSTGDHRDPVHYRFDTKRIQYLHLHSLDALEVLTRMNQTNGIENAIKCVSESVVHSSLSTELLLPKGLSENAKNHLKPEVDGLLKPEASMERGYLGGKDVVALADDLSYPICNLSLRLQMTSAEDSSIIEISEAFFSLATNAKVSESPDHRWASMLSAAGSEVARRVRGQAEEAFFSVLPTFLHGRTQMGIDTSIPALEAAARYLAIAFAASETAPALIASTTTTQLIEKISIIHRMVSYPSTNVVSPMATTTPVPGLGLTPAAATPVGPSSEHMVVISRYLPLLLRMICLQRWNSSGSSMPASKPVQQEQTKLALVLTTLGLHPALTGTNLSFQTLAVVSTLITQPHFTEEMYSYCSRQLKGKMTDPRVIFLFGSVTTSGSTMVKDIGTSLQLNKDGVGPVGEWKPHVKNWEVIEPSGGGEGSSWVGLGLFGARKMY